MRISLLLSVALAGFCHAQSTFSPARPPSIPLAVKSPYLSAWLPVGSDGGGGGYLAGNWPTFNDGAILGWTGLIRVDGQSYIWMGAPSNTITTTVTQTSFQYTSTKSTFVMNVGSAIQMTIQFLSLVSPHDMMRASLPFSYMEVQTQSLDGNAHDVQIYTDISAEWISGNDNNIAQWTYGTTGTGTSGLAYHKVFKQNQQVYVQAANQAQAEWGYWYYATDNIANLTRQSGQDTTVRNNFIQTGQLPNTADTNYRAINNSFPVFGFAVDLGSVTTSPTSTLFSISLYQEQAIQFQGSGPVQNLTSLWTSYFASETDALSFFHADYPTALSIATSLDSQVASDSIAAAGQNYLTITSLSVRQAFGTLYFAGTSASPYLWLKEISSGGDIQTVDVIFPLMPIVLYFNATLLKMLLDPLFINQEAGNWPLTFAMHDLGKYPLALGHSNGVDEMQPLEECGNMIIMTYAYAQRTGDTSYLQQHYPILKQWNNYLVQDALIPKNQISTDDFAGALANQTDLAIKGIIGIGAMAKIASLVGQTADAANYTNISQSYVSQWQQLGINYRAKPPHTTLAYHMNKTHGLLYNIYADKLIGLGLVPQSVFNMQSNFYPTVFNRYGVPLDTRHQYTKLDWQMWAAAAASSATRQKFVNTIAAWIGQTTTNLPLTDLYSTLSGNYPTGVTRFYARPVVGGTFAILALA